MDGVKMPEASFKKNFLCHKFEARQRFLTSAENPRLTFPRETGDATWCRDRELISFEVEALPVLLLLRCSCLQLMIPGQISGSL